MENWNITADFILLGLFNHTGAHQFLFVLVLIVAFTSSGQCPHASPDSPGLPTPQAHVLPTEPTLPHGPDADFHCCAQNGC